jgi:UDP-glucose 4-epimerase
MKILVTGGAGFIGSHIVEHFQGRAEVRVLDNLSTGFPRNLAGLQHEFIAGSILDRELVARAVAGVDYVFHLAAMVSVPESVHQPLACVETNTVGTLILLEAAARARVKKFIFSSSAAIYGDNPVVPKVETMSPEPASPYASTKLDGEFYCGLFTREAGLPTACLRYFNVFGPRQNPCSAYAAAVPIFLARALSNEPLTLHGDGTQTRDFIFVQDVAAANAHFALHTLATGVFNVASGRGLTIRALAETIRELAGSRSEIIPAPARAGDVKHSVADTGKLRAAGFVPARAFAEALPATLRHYAAIQSPAR